MGSERSPYRSARIPCDTARKPKRRKVLTVNMGGQKTRDQFRKATRLEPCDWCFGLRRRGELHDCGGTFRMRY